MPLQVIGAGFGRTGTHSLKLALEELGFSKCYHMEDLVMDDPWRLRYWEAARDGKSVDWEALFKGYQAAVDIPANLFYKELMQLYPDAKVILTVRDAEGWYKSFKDTIVRSSKPGIGQMLRTALRMPFNKMLRQQMKVFGFTGGYMKQFFKGKFETDKPAAISFFNQWNENVKATVPPERLLTCNVKEGWGPLCRFLNVPVPQKPFPHSNTTEEFNSRKF